MNETPYPMIVLGLKTDQVCSWLSSDVAQSVLVMIICSSGMTLDVDVHASY